jgi:hypothetical protein
MGGRIQRVSASGREACAELAEEIHWERRDVEFWWWQIAAAIEFELGWPRALAEWLSTRVTRAALDKRGMEPS